MNAMILLSIGISIASIAISAYTVTTARKTSRTMAETSRTMAETRRMQEERLARQAACPEQAPRIGLAPEHAACPCRTTGRHQIHRCEHGTEWWIREEHTKTSRNEPATWTWPEVLK